MKDKGDLSKLAEGVHTPADEPARTAEVLATTRAYELQQRAPRGRVGGASKEELLRGLLGTSRSAVSVGKGGPLPTLTLYPEKGLKTTPKMPHYGRHKALELLRDFWLTDSAIVRTQEPSSK